MIDPVASGTTAASGSATGASRPDIASRGFERLLVEQLAKELLKSAGDSGSTYASMLPSALADAVQDGGGLGLDIQGVSS